MLKNIILIILNLVKNLVLLKSSINIQQISLYSLNIQVRLKHYNKMIANYYIDNSEFGHTQKCYLSCL